MEKGNEQIQDERLNEQIAKALATAPTAEELRKVLNEEAELHNLFLQGKISGEELEKNLRKGPPHPPIFQVGVRRPKRALLSI